LPLTVGTRRSKLALVQTYLVRDRLEERGYDVDIKKIVTEGDRLTYKREEMGAFVNEINRQLMKGDIDVAVHSLKDVPTKLPEGITFAAFLPRDSPYDALISSKKGLNFDALPKNSVIGTSSIRRRVQTLRRRDDLRVEELRGNLDTRIKKLKAGEFDAIIVAEAGLNRIGIEDGYERLNDDIFIPPANQGTIVAMTRNDSKEEEIVRSLDDEKTRAESEVEREIMKTLGVGCSVPIGILAKNFGGGGITVRANFISKDSFIYDEERFSGDIIMKAREFAVDLKKRFGDF